MHLIGTKILNPILQMDGNKWKESSLITSIELNNSREQKCESMIDYIKKWRNLSIDCKEKLWKFYDWNLHIRNVLGTSLQLSIKLKTIEDSIIRAHKMELSINTNANENISI